MQIRKSKLKQIIKEEVNNAKFIEVREGAFFDDDTALKDPATQLGGSDTISPDNLSLEEIVAQEITQALEGLVEDETSHMRQAAVLRNRAGKQPLSLNQQAALEYHEREAEKEKQNLDKGGKGNTDLDEEDKNWMKGIGDKDKGKWTDYSVEELRAKKKDLMDKEKRTKAEQRTVDQLEFAIRAKTDDLDEDWGNKYSWRKGDDPKHKSVAIVVGRYADDAMKDAEKVGGQVFQEEEKDWIQKADLKKGRCANPGDSDCPEGSPQYNLAMNFKHGAIHKANLKKGKNPHGPG